MRIETVQPSADEIVLELQGMLATYLGGSPEVTRETDLIADLQMESVQVMEFMVEIEDHYDIVVDLETLSGARTVADLAAVVARVRGA